MLRLARQIERTARSCFSSSLLFSFFLSLPPSRAFRLDFLYDGSAAVTLPCLPRTRSVQSIHCLPFRRNIIKADENNSRFVPLLLFPCRSSSATQPKQSNRINEQPTTQLACPSRRNEFVSNTVPRRHTRLRHPIHTRQSARLTTHLPSFPVRFSPHSSSFPPWQLTPLQVAFQSATITILYRKARPARGTATARQRRSMHRDHMGVGAATIRPAPLRW